MQANILSKVFNNNIGLDDKSVDFLVKALNKNNLQGFDYLEFKQSLYNLASLDMSEENKYKSSFATAQTMGLTKSKLLNSAQHYKQVLLKEKNQFDVAIKSQIEKKVSGKRQEVEKLTRENEKLLADIEKLKARIAANNEKIGNSGEDIDKVHQKILDTESGFHTAISSFLSQMELDIENINQHL